MKVSNLIKLSVVLRSDLKPDWNRDICLLDSKNQVNLLFIILSSVLHRQLRKTFSKFYRRYYDLISKFGLKSLLRQGLWNLISMVIWCIN